MVHSTSTNVPFNPYHLTVSVDKFAFVYPGCGSAFGFVPVHVEIALENWKLRDHRQRNRKRRRFNRERSYLSHGRGPRPIPEDAPRKRLVFRQFLGHADDSGRRRGFERFIPWPRRSRIELVFRRWPAHHRPSKQGFSRTRFPPIPSSLSKLFPVLRPPNSVTRRAWSSR